MEVSTGIHSKLIAISLFQVAEESYIYELTLVREK